VYKIAKKRIQKILVLLPGILLPALCLEHNISTDEHNWPRLASWLKPV